MNAATAATGSIHLLTSCRRRWLSNFYWLALLFQLALAGLTSAVHAEARIALVIGNGNYASARLENPKNDAELMTRTLKSVGFEVIKVTDANMQTMRSAFTDFARRLRQSDAVGVFYYAGHGVQVASQNYLIPIGADITVETEIALQAINLNEVLASMKGAASRINVAILDACRDNPFGAQVRSLARGLAPVTAPAGTLIAFATAPGEVAQDGRDGQSPFTAALARSIPVPGLAVEEVFKRTREAVLAVTGNRQTPWEHSSLVGNFVFQPKTVAQEPSGERSRPLQDGGDGQRLAEIVAWDKVKASGDVAALRRHLEVFPGGAYEELAHYKIAQLERQPTVWSWWQTGTSHTPESRGEAEGIFERAVKLEASGGKTESLAEAARLYRVAAERGVVTAMYSLARMYDKGHGLPRNASEAAGWYEKAASAGHTAAQASLATLYEFGEGVPVNLAEALRLYRLAADRGELHAMTSLAYLYAQGKGVARDPKEARKLYETAAERGQPRAMFNLALMHMRGEGGPVNGVEAIRWLNAAVDKGHAGALRELAYLHDEGRFVERSPARAAEYLVAALEALKVEAVAGARSQSAAAADAVISRDHWSFATRRATQKRLVSLGRYSGPATGLFDRSTRRALQSIATAD